MHNSFKNIFSINKIFNFSLLNYLNFNFLEFATVASFNIRLSKITKNILIFHSLSRLDHSRWKCQETKIVMYCRRLKQKKNKTKSEFFNIRRARELFFPSKKCWLTNTNSTLCNVVRERWGETGGEENSVVVSFLYFSCLF